MIAHFELMANSIQVIFNIIDDLDKVDKEYSLHLDKNKNKNEKDNSLSDIKRRQTI